MAPFESLRNEHALILKVLGALERYCDRLEEDPAVDLSDLAAFARFFTTFSELWHHAKEEDVLLPALVKRGFSWDAAPLSRVREEHEQETYLVRVLAQAAGQEPPITAEDRRHAVATVRGLVAFERRHIRGEEQVLLPGAAERLSSAEIVELETRFRELDLHRFGADYVTITRAAEELCARYPSG